MARNSSKAAKPVTSKLRADRPKSFEDGPNLNPKLLSAFSIPDGTFDPLRLALSFAATAKSNGARFRLFTEVEGMLIDGLGNVLGEDLDRKNDQHGELRADIVVNATGAWPGKSPLWLAPCPIKPTPGIMLPTTAPDPTGYKPSLPASDGDIICLSGA